MNVERYIVPHNEILHYGWFNSGHDLSRFEAECKSLKEENMEEEWEQCFIPPGMVGGRTQFRT
jgi:hypothetical protein